MRKVIGICLGVLIPLQAMAWSKGELACFDMVDDPNFVAPQVEVRHRVLHGLRGCQRNKFEKLGDWWQCNVERARPSRKVMQMIVDRRVTPVDAWGNWANLGWARQNVFVVPNMEEYFFNATLTARGIEFDEVEALNKKQYDKFNWETLENALVFHDEVVAEFQCVRETQWCERSKKSFGKFVCAGSFNEIQQIQAGSLSE